MANSQTIVVQLVRGDEGEALATSRSPDCRELAEMVEAWQAVAIRSAPRARVEAEAQVFSQMVVALQTRFGAGMRGSIVLEVWLLADGVRAGGWFP